MRLSQSSLQLAIGLVFICALATAISPAGAAISYQVDGKDYTTSTVQLWYDGLWKEIDWINGTATYALTGDLQGKVVIVPGTWFTKPYDGYLRALAPHRPAGVLIVKPSVAIPGDGMYASDGKDRLPINMPVVEAVSGRKGNPGKIKEGTYITIKVEKNAWKAAKSTAFPVVAASLLSLCEAITIGVIMVRLHQFSLSPIPMLSIGPVCLVLELLGTLLRFAYTLVDPFFIHRMLPYAVSSALFTVHLPFTMASGVLLTFYWAETLRTTQIKASPFVSEYRTFAFGVCIFLFVMEAVAIIVRLTSPKTYTIATYITLIIYTIVTIVLTVCYILTATAILKRLREMGISKTKRVRTMSLRFLLSAVTYIIFIILEICYGALQSRPWGVVITYPLLFAALDATTLLQVVGLRPIAARSRSVTKSSRSTHTSGDVEKGDSLSQGLVTADIDPA